MAETRTARIGFLRQLLRAETETTGTATRRDGAGAGAGPAAANILQQLLLEFQESDLGGAGAAGLPPEVLGDLDPIFVQEQEARFRALQAHRASLEEERKREEREAREAAVALALARAGEAAEGRTVRLRRRAPPRRARRRGRGCG